jgi:hypothetical protein
MAESSERALTPGEATCVAAARHEAIIPFEDT